MIVKKITLAILIPVLVQALSTGYLWLSGFLFQGGPLEKIAIGVSLTRLNSLVWIALGQGFDKEQGLLAGDQIAQLARPSTGKGH